ncbi:MAG: SIR2 family protein [Beijerinckiaceae bacterium]|nr:SIR2 family protein [Beijerinckiaceae bacterium]
MNDSALQRLAHSMLDGSAVLFVGAGLSFLSKNKNNQPIPNGEQLRNTLQIESEATKPHPLDKISNYFVKKKGSTALYDLLQTALKVKSVDRRLTELYQLPWRRIYTTNYDDAIEIARKPARGAHPYTISQKAISIPDGAVIHINGFIDAVTPQTVSSDLKLTDFSYANSNFEENSDWNQLFRNDLRVARAIVFAGYSLSDLDITRILISESALREKTLIYIAPDADDVEISSLDPYGAVISTGIESLFLLIDEARKTYERPAVREVFYSLADLSEEEKALPRRPGKSNAIKIHEQLVYGTVHLSEIISGAFVFEKVPFNTPRDAVIRAAESSIRGDSRDIAIVGGIASGKSFAALQFAERLISAGYRVFWVKDARRLAADLSTLTKLPGKVCLIVDGYGRYLDEVRDYARQRPAEHLMLLTERSATHEVVWPVLRSHLFSGTIPEIVLDHLTHAESKGLDDLVNFAGLWPEDLAGKTAAQRINFIVNDLESSLYRLLLEILRSKKVQAEIESLLTPLRSDADAHRFFATAFIVSILGYNFWINDWQSFYKIKNAREVLRNYSEHVGHFVLIDSSSIRPRSSVASLFMLQNYVDDATVCECLSDVYEVAVSNTYGDQEFEQAKYDLIRYNKIEPLFDDNKKLRTITNYYEMIRAIGETRNNPDYWLQYGIACTIAGSLEVAQSAFNNAYAREKARKLPNTIKIDNYYARFLLEKSAATDDPAAAFDSFREGVGLLLKQIFRDDNRHYPFKAGRSLSEIAARHLDQWSQTQKTAFVGNCRSLLTKAEDWQKRNGPGQPDVIILIRETRNIIEKFSTY